MRLIDAINNVVLPADRDKFKWSYTADAEAICESLGVSGMWNFPEAVDDALRAYPIFNWLCTDEHVGLDALYLNDEPVGCSYRSARKNSYEIEWISKEAANKVRQFILDHADRPEFKIMDPDQDIGEDFAVHFVGQNLSKHGTFEGRPVEVVGGFDIMGRSGMNVPYGDDRYNKFVVKDGDEERMIAPEDLRFPFNVTKLAVGVRVKVVQDIHKGKTGRIIEVDEKSGAARDRTWYLVELDGRDPDGPENEGRYWCWPFEVKAIGE